MAVSVDQNAGVEAARVPASPPSSSRLQVPEVGARPVGGRPKLERDELALGRHRTGTGGGDAGVVAAVALYRKPRRPSLSYPSPSLRKLGRTFGVGRPLHARAVAVACVKPVIVKLVVVLLYSVSAVAVQAVIVVVHAIGVVVRLVVGKGRGGRGSARARHSLPSFPSDLGLGPLVPSRAGAVLGRHAGGQRAAQRVALGRQLMAGNGGRGDALRLAPIPGHAW